jgi:hypothetical protein
MAPRAAVQRQEFARSTGSSRGFYTRSANKWRGDDASDVV